MCTQTHIHTQPHIYTYAHTHMHILLLSIKSQVARHRCYMSVHAGGMMQALSEFVCVHIYIYFFESTSFDIVVWYVCHVSFMYVT